MVLTKLGAFYLYAGPLTLNFFSDAIYYPVKKTLLINNTMSVNALLKALKFYQLFVWTSAYTLFVLNNIKLVEKEFHQLLALKSYFFLQRWVNGALTNRVITSWSLVKYNLDLILKKPGLIILGTLFKNDLIFKESIKLNIPIMALVNTESTSEYLIDYPIPLHSNMYTLYFLCSIFLYLLFLK